VDKAEAGRVVAVGGGGVERSAVHSDEVAVVMAATGAGGGLGVRESGGDEGWGGLRVEALARNGADARSNAAPLDARPLLLHWWTNFRDLAAYELIEVIENGKGELIREKPRKYTTREMNMTYTCNPD
jgi:hypothetical protein